MAAAITQSQPPDGAAAITLAGWLDVPAPARPAERLQVHAQGYPARIHDALADTYPAVARLLGGPAFRALAQRYAAAVPLASYNLNDAGAGLGELLRHDPAGREQPVLADLAELEWRVARAFHAVERAPLDPGRLGWTVNDWAAAVLQFQPAVAVLSSAWPLLAIWADSESAETRPQIAEHLLIRRAGLVVRCEAIAAEECAALRLLLAGHALGESMERLAATGIDPSAVSEWFARWVAAGMLAGACRTRPPESTPATGDDVIPSST